MFLVLLPLHELVSFPLCECWTCLLCICVNVVLVSSSSPHIVSLTLHLWYKWFPLENRVCIYFPLVWVVCEWCSCLFFLCVNGMSVVSSPFVWMMSLSPVTLCEWCTCLLSLCMSGVLVSSPFVWMVSLFLLFQYCPCLFSLCVNGVLISSSSLLIMSLCVLLWCMSSCPVSSPYVWNVYLCFTSCLIVFSGLHGVEEVVLLWLLTSNQTNTHVMEAPALCMTFWD